MEAEADRLLEQVGLSAVTDHPYSTLSSGERVRSLMARALAVRPAAAAAGRADQRPGSAGPRAGAGDGAADVRAGVAEEGGPPPTVLFISHHVEELPPATSHVLLLSEGRPAAAGHAGRGAAAGRAFARLSLPPGSPPEQRPLLRGSAPGRLGAVAAEVN